MSTLLYARLRFVGSTVEVHALHHATVLGDTTSWLGWKGQVHSNHKSKTLMFPRKGSSSYRVGCFAWHSAVSKSTHYHMTLSMSFSCQYWASDAITMTYKLHFASYILNFLNGSITINSYIFARKQRNMGSSIQLYMCAAFGIFLQKWMM